MSDALGVLASLRLEDGRRWGEAATTWQLDDAREALIGKRRRCYLTRPRGASKTTDVAAIHVADLLELAPDLSRSYALAADRDQGQLIFDSVEGFLQRSDELHRALKLDRWTLTNRTTGASLEIMAADAPGAWGKRPWRVTLDEYAQWPATDTYARLYSAMTSALGKVRGSRLVVLTSAGDPSHPAGKLIKRARASSTWHVNEIPGPCPWLSEEDLEEDRQALPPWEFKRLHLNEWTAPGDRLTRPEDLAAAVVLDGALAPRPGITYVVALDVGIVHDRTVAGVMHVDYWNGRRKLVLDRMETWQGSRAHPVPLGVVEAWLFATAREYRAKVLYDEYQAAQLAERLTSRGVRMERVSFTPTENSRRALRLFQVIRNHELEIPDDEELIDELANVRFIETSPGVYRLDHDRARHDDRAQVLAMGADELMGHVTGSERTTAGSSVRLPKAPSRRQRITGPERLTFIPKVGGRK